MYKFVCNLCKPNAFSQQLSPIQTLYGSLHVIQGGKFNNPENNITKHTQPSRNRKHESQVKHLINFGPFQDKTKTSQSFSPRYIQIIPQMVLHRKFLKRFQKSKYKRTINEGLWAKTSSWFYGTIEFYCSIKPGGRFCPEPFKCCAASINDTNVGSKS